jgi:hypothetical protein
MLLTNSRGKTVRDVWDGVDLKLTFRRTVSENIMNLWWELLSLMDDFSFSEEEDHTLWSYNQRIVLSVMNFQRNERARFF